MRKAHIEIWSGKHEAPPLVVYVAEEFVPAQDHKPPIWLTGGNVLSKGQLQRIKDNFGMLWHSEMRWTRVSGRY